MCSGIIEVSFYHLFFTRHTNWLQPCPLPPQKKKKKKKKEQTKNTHCSDKGLAMLQNISFPGGLSVQ